MPIAFAQPAKTGDVEMADDDSRSGGKTKIRALTGRDHSRIEELEEQVAVLQKLCLSTSHRVRVVQSVVLWSGKLDTDSDIIRACQKGTKNYDTLSKKLKSDGKKIEAIREEIGLPHIHAWSECFALMVKQMATTDPELSKKFDEKSSAWSWREIHKAAPTFKATKMHSPAEKRLELSFPMEDHVNASNTEEANITPVLATFHIKKMVTKHSSYRELIGCAPMGNLERQVQASIDARAEEKA